MQAPEGWQVEKHDLFEGDEQKLEAFLPKLDRKLRRRLKRVPAESVHFRLRAAFRKPRYQVRLLARSPLGSAFAAAEDEQLVGALKEAGERVARQLEEARERIVLAHRQVRTARRAARSRLAEQVRQVWRKPEERETLAVLLRSAVRDLRRHLAAEFGVLQLEKKLPPGYRLDDLFDEVVARALQQADRIDLSRETLDRVLLRLAHERIDELARLEAHEVVRLEEIVPDEALQQDEDWVADNDPWWPEQPLLLLEDLVPGASSPEDMDEAEEAERVTEALRQLSPEARRALLLHGLEGYGPEEIAEVTGRSVEQVREDVRQAEAHLTAALDAG